MKFIDLFAGLGGFHKGLEPFGECVFASEIDPALRELYQQNFPKMRGKIFGDLRECIAKNLIPAHDLLCAGFPCQPFSKSGSQRGLKDTTRGTLFHSIVEILRSHRPKYLILENVGNFPRHDGGRTWKIVRETLESLEYNVQGTEFRRPPLDKNWRHVGNPRLNDSQIKVKRVDFGNTGEGLISPHHLGYPHHRERFFIVASLKNLPSRVFPVLSNNHSTSLVDILDRRISTTDQEDTKLSPLKVEVIEHWGRFIRLMPPKIPMPWFPLWADELDATYPYSHYAPANPKTPAKDLREHAQRLDSSAKDLRFKRDLIRLLPPYAQDDVDYLPYWKVRQIKRSRDWLESSRIYLTEKWIRKLRELPPTHRKFEHNCRDGGRDIWQYLIQFRPSGLRLRGIDKSPALVAISESQIPIYGPYKRHFTRVEGLRLQGFPDHFALPDRRSAAFRALGNAVHVQIVRAIGELLLEQNKNRARARQNLERAA